MQAPPQCWLIKGVLPAGAFAALYGPSGGGKSFLAIDLCTAVAEGVPWFGYRVRRAPVTYICLEGAEGFRKRLAAWRASRRRCLPSSIHIVTDGFNLKEEWRISALASELRARNANGGLVIIDTLMRAAGGADENSSADMAQIVAACNRLQRESGGAVLLIHHTGKDIAKGLRGHSSLHGALDAAIEVKKTGGRRKWVLSKSKDDQTGASHTFSLAQVELGEDDEGEPITSCVVETSDGARAQTNLPARAGGSNQRIADAVVRELLTVSGERGQGGAPETERCVMANDAISVIRSRLTCRESDRAARAEEALSGLVARGVYVLQGGWVWHS